MSWPPHSLSRESELPEEKAELLISRGAAFFGGLFLQANHTLIRQPRFYATVSFAAAGKHLEASPQPSATLVDASLVLSGQPLEKPSMEQCFGALPGTVTLNRYINAISCPRHPERLPKYEIQPRAMDNLLVLQRLHYLMRNGWDNDIEIAEEFLCTQLVYDPLWQKGAPPQLARQIMVLIAALSNPSWIDFREPTSQVLANYYDTEDVDVEKHFWQQLLLSVELDLRLRAAGDQEHSMISHVPDKVAWDLALSKVWLSKMALVPIDEGFLRPATHFHVTALTKDAQRERLLNFARSMKWVGMHDVESMLEEDSDGGIPLEFQNAHTSSWITGTILPGPSVCWLAMRCLIDCDATIINPPHGFDKMESNFGFQYGGCTYWYFQNIVGKVLGASRGVNQDHGWVGPCIPSDDLFKLQTVLIRTEDVPVKPSKSRVQKMAARSAPLGPPAHRYPVRDYVLPLPDSTNIVDCVRVQKLAFNMHSLPISADDPTTYDAAIVFAIANEIVPIRLRYNVSFIYAPPCCGQHPLFWDYAYRTTKVDELLLDLRCWNGVFVDAKTPSENSGCASSSTSSSGADAKGKKMPAPESILVVEAYGVEDNEVLARAWASHIGFSAVVATGGET
ncbi:hypothetical protein HO133_003632 [Letharia lupina]|uniref:Uncharacterized protein n=1 Tax=Letharia lupina TaxID=560253 RepID=A0A8H6CAA7_9LECA|nr:uncharacterized protein HO133_003632 [Letharia lupina]KAF6219807.1 hypothetical protein HO133_003632 [Letharia lupina]